MPETILLDGVPLGEFTLTDVETHIGPLDPLPGLDAAEDRLWPHSEHLWREGFLGDARQRLSLEMLAPPPDLSFEVRDEDGMLVAVDFANVVLAHSAEEYPVVIVVRKRAMAAIAAVIRPRGLA